MTERTCFMAGNNEKLNQLQCSPCRLGGEPLKPDQWAEYAKQIDGNWQVVDGHHLERTFKFKNFKQALAFTNQIGDLAEQQGHHPDIHLSWGQVIVRLWTHKIDGLHENDFILAAKIDHLIE